MSTETISTLQRRQFLIQGANAASVIPASTLGRDGTVAPSNRILMAGIGTGGRGASVLKLVVRSLANPDGTNAVRGVTLLGHEVTLEWKQTAEVLEVSRPGHRSRRTPRPCASREST